MRLDIELIENLGEQKDAIFCQFCVILVGLFLSRWSSLQTRIGHGLVNRQVPQSRSQQVFLFPARIGAALGSVHIPACAQQDTRVGGKFIIVCKSSSSATGTGKSSLLFSSASFLLARLWSCEQYLVFDCRTDCRK